VAKDHSAHHVHGTSEGTPDNGVVWVKKDFALSSLVPLADVLLLAFLEEALVVWDAVLAVDESCHCV